MPPLSTLNKTALTLAVSHAIAMSSAQAATIMVTDFGDGPTTNPNTCTLRQAVESANLNQSQGTCTAGTQEDLIIFANTTEQTISLTEGSLDLSAYITIQGAIGRPIVIDGSNNTPHSDNFRVSFRTAHLDLLTISNARNDGVSLVFNNFQSVRITNSTISDSLSTGINVESNNGNLTIERSTISSNGVGRAARGGLVLDGDVTIDQSTISGNSNVYSGGGIAMDRGSLLLTNSTITDNSSAIGGGAFFGGPLTRPVTAVMYNNIISGNSAVAESGKELQQDADAVVNLNFNILGSASTNNQEAFDGVNYSNPTNIIANNSGGSGGTNITDIIDNQLRDNGGPTLTHNLPVNSIARNAAGSERIRCAETDQRNEAKGSDDSCDIGAVEYLPIAQAIEVNTSVDTSGTSACSLRDAIISVNTNQAQGGCTAGGVDDVINTNFNIKFIALTSQLPTIESDVTIERSYLGGGELLLIGNDSNRVLDIAGYNTEAQLDNLAIIGGSSTGSGGGLRARNGAFVTLTNSVITDNAASSIGGGVSSTYYATLRVIDSKIEQNSAGTNGGGASTNRFSQLEITNSTIEDNTASSAAGGARAQNFSILTVTNSTVSGNSAAGGNSGGIDVRDDSILSLGDSVVSNNTSSTDGGGLVVRFRSSASVDNSTISGNLAEDDAGGVFIQNDSSGSISINNSTISGNSAVNGTGGGIRLIDRSDLNITNSTIVNNAGSNDTRTGGILVQFQNPENELTIQNSILSNVGREIDFNSGIFTSLGNNIFGNSAKDTGRAFSSNVVTNNTDFIATSDTSQGTPTAASAIFEPLGNNGGPTQTHALVFNSPALNAINNDSCPTTDQRGQPRNVGLCDIGAFEAQASEAQLDETCFVVKAANGNVVTFCL